MRYKSKLKSVYFEPIDSPLSTKESLWLLSTITDNRDVHFFFQETTHLSLIHQITISTFDAYKIMQEGTAATCISKYFKSDTPSEKWQYNKKGERHELFKIWGTDFVKEIYSNSYFANYEPSKKIDQFEYCIYTSSEVVEMITQNPPVWKTHKNRKLADILREIVENLSNGCDEK